MCKNTLQYYLRIKIYFFIPLQPTFFLTYCFQNANIFINLLHNYIKISSTERSIRTIRTFSFFVSFFLFSIMCKSTINILILMSLVHKFFGIHI